MPVGKAIRIASLLGRGLMSWLGCGLALRLGRGLGVPCAVALVVSSIVSTPVLAQRSNATPIDRVIAVVNREAITAQELESRITMVETQYREQRRAPPPREELRKQVLEQLILVRAELQYAAEVGLKPTEAEIDRGAEEVAQRNGLTVAGLREQLKEAGIGYAVFREQLAGDIAAARLREREASNKVTISEAEVDARLAKTGAGGVIEYEISQILLRLPSEPDAAAVKAKTALAEQLLERARASGDFGALAREFSEAPESFQGGSLGWRTRDRLPEVFVGAVAPLEPGQIAPIVRSPAGLHLLKLTDKRAQAPQDETVERTHARHILIASASSESAGDATRRLAEFKRSVESGKADFAELARQFSSDGSAAKGGDLGWLYPGETVPDFERAMAKLPIDGISDPVRTQFGVHLIQVLERRSDTDSPERIRASARQALRDQKAEEAFDQFLRELRDRAYVEYRIEQP